MSHNVFLSYRNKPLGNAVVRELHRYLEKEHGCTVFWDKTTLHAGDNWSDEIYDAIRSSDVLIVVMEANVLDSDWVQREVDLAHGAHVRILPLYVVGEDVEAVAKKLGIEAKQRLAYDTGEPPLESVWAEIQRLAALTRKAQEAFVKDLKGKWDNRPIDPKVARKSANRGTFQHGDHPARLRLISGDITAFKNIDVIVNTENDYLQMARVYEAHTVSSRLRYYGSLIDHPNKLLLEDTVQMELDAYAAYTGRGRPIGPAQVIVTTSGHPESKLAEAGIRYIFHAITVIVAHQFQEKMQAIDNDGITTCVINTLKAVEQVNERRGVVSQEKLEFNDGVNIRKPYEQQMQQTSSYQPITSIIFPLFCAGQAGRPTGQIIQPMLNGFRDFLEQTPNTSLTDIHLCVYYEHDIPTVEQAMGTTFERVSR